MRLSLRLTLNSFFTALGVILSPIWIPILASKAFPGQHLINALAGVILGPIDAAIIAILVGIIRNMYGVGTIYAFPGGIPGGVVVGVAYMFLSRVANPSRARLISLWMEPIGTVIIGATLSIYIVAPWIGDVAMLSKLEALGTIPLYVGWTLSSLSGVFIAFIVILVLDRGGLLAYLTR